MGMNPQDLKKEGTMSLKSLFSHLYVSTPLPTVFGSLLVIAVGVVLGEHMAEKPVKDVDTQVAEPTTSEMGNHPRVHEHPQHRGRAVSYPMNDTTSNIVAWWAGPSSLTNAPPLDDTASITYGALPTYPDFSGILINGGEELSVEFPGVYVVGLTFDAEYDILRESVIADPVEGLTTSLTDEATHRLLISNDGRPYTQVPIVQETSLTSAVPNNTATYSTAMVVALEVGTQRCHAHGIVTDSVPADGALVRLNTSYLTASSASQSTGQLTSTTPALIDVEATSGSGNTVLTGSVLGTGVFDFDATLVITVAGNLTVDVAQAAHTTGTASLPAGATLHCSM